MKFTYKEFNCDVEKYRLDDKSFVIRFYDAKKEQAESDIRDYVLVDPGFGYICLKYKGANALLSGFLNEKVFTTDAMVDAAIDYVESLSEYADLAYIPHKVMKVQFTGSVEYNGEY